MISLDKYASILNVNKQTMTVKVQAGIRLRDLQKAMYRLGLALPACGSTDVQSLGGLCATDVHGTGKEHAFLSEQLVSLRIVDGRGVARTATPADDVFHAAMGGLGMIGIVTEVEIRCIPLYNLEKSIRIINVNHAQRDIEQILTDYDHVSFYYMGGVHSDIVRMNIWKNTDRSTSWLLPLRKMYLELIDFVFSSYILVIAGWAHRLDKVAGLGFRLLRAIMDGHVTVYPATSGFARRLFYHHDEIEYGVPFEKYTECLAEVRDYLVAHRSFSIIEVRFSPNRTAGLIAPGAGRRTCYIELAYSLETDSTPVFVEVEKIFQKYDGHVHLGKWTRVTGADLHRMYGERFERFLRVRRQQDPDNKFMNIFTQRLCDMGSVEVMSSEISRAF